MKRRNFLKYTAPLTAAPLVLSGASAMRPFATQKMLSTLTTDCDIVSDRVLVLVQLRGGNDGLNTIIPIEQYSLYEQIRPTIKISQSDYIPLDSTLAPADQLALHPAMSAIKNMYDAGMVNIVQGVGYENQNGSHFKSRDLYWTGGDGLTANQNIEHGWVGRYLDAAYPGIAGNPTSALPDPLGIQLGDNKPSLGFSSSNINPLAVNLYQQNPAGYYDVVNSVGGQQMATVPTSEYGEEIAYIMNIENSVEVYAQRITNVYNAGAETSVSYPSNNELSEQFATIARLLAGGSKTKVFMTNLDGFDTHADQVNSNGATTVGEHAVLLTKISEAVAAFNHDLTTRGIEDKVLTCTLSEFGRKAVENGSFGTDHGTLSCMLLFGSGVNPGVTGTNVDLSNLYQGQQLQGIQNDYRQVFATLLQDWLGASDNLVSTAFPTDSFVKIPIINTAAIADPSCYENIALPIELKTFTARAISNEYVEVEWETTLEINADYFEVQSSADSTSFKTIGRVEANGEASQYEFIDYEPFTGISYYRLKQVEKNGSFTFSSVEKVEIEHKIIKEIRVSPNPTRFNASVSTTAFEDTSATLRVISMQGMIHRIESVEIRQGFNKFPISVESLNSGLYIVSLEDKNGQLLGQERLLVQK